MGGPERYVFPYDVDEDGTIKGTSGGASIPPWSPLMIFPDYSGSREEGDIAGRIEDAKKELETDARRTPY